MAPLAVESMASLMRLLLEDVAQVLNFRVDVLRAVLLLLLWVLLLLVAIEKLWIRGRRVDGRVLRIIGRRWRVLALARH
jgi:hypothetical protein